MYMKIYVCIYTREAITSKPSARYVYTYFCVYVCTHKRMYIHI